MLPGEDGLAICRRLSDEQNLSIIMLSALELLGVADGLHLIALAGEVVADHGANARIVVDDDDPRAVFG